MSLTDTALCTNRTRTCRSGLTSRRSAVDAVALCAVADRRGVHVAAPQSMLFSSTSEPTLGAHVAAAQSMELPSTSEPTVVEYVAAPQSIELPSTSEPTV
jgi:hypothetical protein